MEKITNANIPEQIANNLARSNEQVFLRLVQPDRPAEEYRYQELMNRAGQWQSTFVEDGIQPGDRIIVILPHSLDLYASFVGALLGGIVPSMFSFPSPKYSEEEYFKTIWQLVETVSPKIIITYSELKQKLQASSNAPSSLKIIDSSCIQETVHANQPAFSNPNPEETAFIQFSSGTTGIKKGVALSHRALLWQINAYSQSIGLNSNDHIVSWLPLYHDMGLICCFFLPLLTLTPITAISPFDWTKKPGLLLKAIHQYKGTLCWLPNFAYNFLAKNIPDRELSDIDLSSIRGFINCAEPISSESHAIFLKRFMPHGVTHLNLGGSYAMAENTYAVTSGGFNQPLLYDFIDERVFITANQALPVPPVHPNKKLMASSGKALPDTQIHIISDSGERLPERNVGEIVIQSPCLLHEYHNNPEATHSSLKNGSFFTGDLGYLVNGHLFVTGRKKDMIIIAGKNIYPQDIESIVNEIEGVIPGRCVAFGIYNEQIGTEKLVVLVETHEKDSVKKDALEKQIFQSIASRTEIVPDEIWLLEHMWLLKSSSGKISRKGNRQRYLEQLSEKIPDAKAIVRLEEAVFTEKETGQPGEILDVVFSALRKVVGSDKVTWSQDMPLITSGLVDSFSLVTLVLELENQFDLEIPSERLEPVKFNTPLLISQNLSELIQQKNQQDADQKAIESRMTKRDKGAVDFMKLPEPVDLLILGSSKVQFFAPNIAREFGYRAYNFYVNSARAEDWYCIYSFVAKHNKIPLRTILVGVDIESFSDGVPVDQRLLLSKHLVHYLDEEDKRIISQQPDAPVSPELEERFRSTLAKYKLGMAEGGWAQQEHDRLTGELIPFTLALKERNPLSIVDPLDAAPQYTMRMKGFNQLSRKRLTYFGRIIEACLYNKINLAIFYTPVHARLEKFLTENTTYKIRQMEFQRIITKLDAKYIRFFDTSTPDRFGGYADDFYNGAHIGTANADILFRYLLSNI